MMKMSIVAFLLVDKDFEETDMVATIVSEAQGDYEGPHEVIDGLMEPKMDLAKKQKLMAQMLSPDLSAMEKE